MRGAEDNPVPQDRLYSHGLALGLAASATFGFAQSCFYLLPKFLVSELAASASQIGEAMAVCSAATLAAVPLVAFWADRVPRKRLMTVGAVLMMLSSAAFVWIDSVGPAMFALRAVHGVAFCLEFIAIGALAADLAPPSRLAQALGFAGVSMLVMNAIAPPIAEPLAAHAGWASVFALAAAASAVSVALSLAVPAGAPIAKLSASADFAVLRALLRRGSTQHYAIVTAAIGAAFGVMFTFPQPFAIERGRMDIGGFFAAYAITALIVRLGFGSLPDRLGRMRVSVFAFNLYTVVVLATAALRPGWLEVIGALLGIAHGMFFPAFNAIAFSQVGPSERGKIMSVFAGAFYGGLAFAVLGLGLVAEAVGYEAVFVLTSAALLAAGALLVFSVPLRGAAGEAGP